MTTMNSPSAPQKPKLLDRVREAIRARHYSRRTGDAYIGWIKRYIFFHGKRHPAEMGAEEVTRFLSALALDGHVAASTQNQALSALLFLYHEVLQQNLPWLDGIVRAKRPMRLPVVLTREEVQAVLTRLHGTPRLMATLLYGAGLRLLECAELRVKDVDFSLNQILVRNGKGQKDRVTVLPAALKRDLARHLEDVRQQHQKDLSKGAGWVELPGALERKYPNAGREWGWHWVFPATSMYVHRESGNRRRHHLHKSVLQRAVKEAVRRAGIAKPATCHLSAVTPAQAGTFRHSGVYPAFCGTTHLLEDGYLSAVPACASPHADRPSTAQAGDIRPVQELLGHKDVSKTMIYTHVLNRGPAAVRSPADSAPLRGAERGRRSNPKQNRSRPAEIDCRRPQPIPVRSNAPPATPGPLPARGYRQNPWPGAPK